MGIERGKRERERESPTPTDTEGKKCMGGISFGGISYLGYIYQTYFAPFLRLVFSCLVCTFRQCPGIVKQIHEIAPWS